MLSDLSCNSLSFDIPIPPDHGATDPEEGLVALLDFDDLLDIAREFEFTRTITHVWPCEEPGACSQTELNDILAAIASTPNVEESPLPLPSPTYDPVHGQNVDSYTSTSIYPMFDVNARVSRESMTLSSDDGQPRAEVQLPSAAILCGWSPPDGSPFLDLDDDLMLSQSTTDMWIPPWCTTFFAPPYTQPANSDSHSSATVPETGTMQPQTLKKESRTPPGTTSDEMVNDPRKEDAPFIPLPTQPSASATLEPVRAQPTLQINLGVPNQTTTTLRAKAPKTRQRLPSTPATSGAYTAKYAKAPRGGIPPHIARTVTKANILRVEKERKVMRDAFSSTTTREGKKPSVLRRAAKIEREGKVGDGSSKKPFTWEENNEKELRAAKRKKV